MTLLSDARSLLLQAANAANCPGLSEAQKAAMRGTAWVLSPCTCGAGPTSRSHSLYCINGEHDPSPTYYCDGQDKDRPMAVPHG